MQTIITVVLGFLQICAGVVLLQLSKSAKDVPDAAVFKGDLDQVRTVAEQEEPESEPKADAIRGTAAIIRRLSMSRQKVEAEEAKRIQEAKLLDQMEPIHENERVEWDGLRRRKTLLEVPDQFVQRRKTVHPPLGMAYFPDEDESHGTRAGGDEEQVAFDGGFMNSLRRARASFLPGQKPNSPGLPDARSPMYPVPLTQIPMPYKGSDSLQHPGQADGSVEMSQMYGLPANPRDFRGNASTRLTPPAPQSQGSLVPTPPPHSAKRQFSFQNVFRRKSEVKPDNFQSFRPVPRPRPASRQGPVNSYGAKSATEEERLGLVKGDSTIMLPPPEYVSDEEDWQVDVKEKSERFLREQRNDDEYDRRQNQADAGRTSPESRNLIVNDYEDLDRRRRKEWEGQGHTDGGAGGGGPAFI